MDVRIELKIEIDAPIAHVFEVFTDISSAARNVSAIEQVELLSPHGNGVGTRWRETRKMFGMSVTEELEITRLEPEHCFLVEAESRGISYLIRYDFVPGGERRAAVSMLFVARPVSLKAKLFSFASVFFRRANRNAFLRGLADMKVACERR